MDAVLYPIKIYKASAGSGKTYTLVKEYLKIVFKEYASAHKADSFKQILAITFTRKAAAEMKERIIKYLIEISSSPDSTMLQSIQSETGIANIPFIAKEVLKSILHNYSDFHISTIDSFFQSILRAYTRELKLSTNYEVELDTEKVLQEIIDKIFLDIETNKDLKSWMQDYMFALLNQGSNWDFRKSLVGFGNNLFNEKYVRFQEYFSDKFQDVDSQSDYFKAIREFRDNLYSIRETFENDMDKRGREVLDLIKANGFDVDDFKYGKSGIYNYFKKILKDYKDYLPGNRVIDCLEGEDKWISPKCSNKSQLKALIQSSLLNKLGEIIKYYNEKTKDYATANVCLKKLYQIGLFYELNKLLGDYRTENELIFIADTNRLLSSVTKDSYTPFIYEKIGVKYKWLMIDEFQDTSDKQWDNIKVLVADAVSMNNDVILVGDAKQSIYRWRGSNMNLINEVEFNHIVLTLDTNYRSCKNIVKFNNTLFSLVVEQAKQCLEDDFSKAYINDKYSDIVQKTNIKEEGYVYVKLFQETVKKDFIENSLLQVKGYIEECKKNGYTLQDIAIIVRTNDEGTEVAEYLGENNYAIISSDALKIEASLKIKLIIYALMYIYSNENNLYKYLITFHFCKIHFGENKNNAVEQIVCEYYQGNKKEKYFKLELLDKFFENIDLLLKMSVTEAVGYIKCAFELKTDAFIIDFEQSILKFSSKNSHNVLSFLEEWDKKIKNESISVAEDVDAIRLITIHKSKGLEFPVVIIPFMGWSEKSSEILVETNTSPFDTIKYIPVNSTQELKQTLFENDYYKEELNKRCDSLNMLYVAITRAAEALFININHRKKIEEPYAESYGSITDLINNCILSNIDVLNKDFVKGKEELFLPNVNIKEGHFKIGKLAKIPKEKEDKENITPKELKDIENKPKELNYNRFGIKKNSMSLVEYVSFDIENKASYGWVLHKIMSEINDEKDVDIIITNNIAEGLINFDEAIEIRGIINRLFENKEIYSWFDTSKYQHFNEKEILDNSFAVYRPDKVLISNNKAIVIDFKTGKPSEKHRLQLQNYANILSQMGYAIEQAYLLYLNPINLVKVSC